MMAPRHYAVLDRLLMRATLLLAGFGADLSIAAPPAQCVVCIAWSDAPGSFLAQTAQSIVGVLDWLGYTALE